MITTWKNFILISVAVMALLATGCGNLLLPEPTGDLFLSLDEFTASTLLPDVEMEFASYRILGQGPDGASFDEVVTESPVTIQNLAVGNWQITVEGRNNSDETVGRGVDSIQINAGMTTMASVRVEPIGGPGTLNITILWPEAEVDVPSVDALLIPTAGDSVVLPFTQTGPGQATYQGPVQSGYYTLSIRLEDDGVIVAGATETVRIVAESETSGIIEFTDINQPGGSVEIDIIWDMDEPIAVEIAGVLTQITTTDAMTLTASAPAETDPVTFRWYINGEQLGTGATHVVQGDIGEGFYRVDVVAVNADGSRSGSSSDSFRVVLP